MGKWKVGSGAHEANGEWALGSRASGASRAKGVAGERRQAKFCAAAMTGQMARNLKESQ